ncbi:MAG: hypothetical protein JJE23_14220 [Thermoleophilia bacterium]|nr:hypothetical protein [Thermoleophilia bacterium]
MPEFLRRLAGFQGSPVELALKARARLVGDELELDVALAGLVRRALRDRGLRRDGGREGPGIDRNAVGDGDADCGVYEGDEEVGGAVETGADDIAECVVRPVEVVVGVDRDTVRKGRDRGRVRCGSPSIR